MTISGRHRWVLRWASMGAFAWLGSVAGLTAIAAEGARTIEEVVVQARKQDETLQDVPVTVSSVGGEQLASYQLDQPQEIVERIPNMRVQVGGSGSGGTINLRGVGSSAISAAFDSAVAFNIDGVQVTRLRMVQGSFMDLEQVDVLKGPQSLYFGKSASAGVMAFRSANPTEEFEASLTSGYEFEEEGYFVDGYVSGPITDTLGARVAFRYSEADEMYENNAPGVANPEVGEEDFNYRVTLAWDPSDTFSANLKVTHAKHEADNGIGPFDQQCIVAGDPQESLFPGGTPPGAGAPSGYDCDDDDRTVTLNDLTSQSANFGNRPNLVPFEDLETVLARLEMVWDFSDDHSVTSTTAFFNLDEEGAANYSYDLQGAGTGFTNNNTESWSQELRFAGSINDMIDYQLGFFYQERELAFLTSQHAVGGSAIAQFLALSPDGRDPTDPLGRTEDWRKEHYTDTETRSVFASVTLRPNDRLELTAGARYADDEVTNRIEVPYLYFLFAPPAFVPIGFVSPDIEVDDTNFSPEVSALFALTDDVNLFVAYKSGYKMGGVDNSALPSRSLSDAAIANDFSALIFDTEKGEGIEAGMKGTFMDGTLRLNVTAFNYVYEDLQVQSFDSVAIQFATTNAGELTTSGIEADFVWLPDVEGLTVYGALAFTDAEFSETFAPQGFDIEGRAPSGAADFAFNGGFDYVRPIGNSLELRAGLNVSWSDDYHTQNEDPVGHVQDSHWLLNANASIGSADGRWSVGVVGRNLTDEVVVITSGGRPFADSSNNTINPDGSGATDNILNLNRGRQVFLQATVAL